MANEAGILNTRLYLKFEKYCSIFRKSLSDFTMENIHLSRLNSIYSLNLRTLVKITHKLYDFTTS